MQKILIVEDEKVLREMYRDKLIQEGFEVDAVASAEDGLEFLKTQKPDLILLDILLPKKNGISFLSQIKENPDLSAIPVIAFSNFDSPNIKKEAYALGIKDYLIKTNYTPQEIVAKIKSYLT